MNKIALQINTNTVITPTDNKPNYITNSIFLAGPITDWRKKAIEYLYSQGYSGTIFNPEVSTDQYYNNYDSQFKWEHDHLDKCDIIVFWIPRDLKNHVTGLATNTEFGLYADSNKLVVGFPDDADSVQYIQKCCEERNIPVFHTLEDTLNAALEKVNNQLRTGIECEIPSFIWTNKEFQNWYQQQLAVGNKLLSFKCLYSFIMPKAQKLFFWICHVKTYIAAEDRIKSNEFIISRTNMIAIVMHYKNNIILVKEYRSPCCNQDCYVYELPGGSSINDTDNLTTAKNEISEETGISIDIDRLKLINTRQAIATLSAHQLTAYKVELTKEEFDTIKQQENSVHGLHEDSEYTYLTIKTIDEILNESLVDWNNIGIILSALYKDTK